MATGDITAVRIAAEGWYAEIEIEGFATGATYDFGWAEGNVPTAKTPYFTVVSEGFDAAGNATTVTRTIYATIQQRKPYPDDAQNEESVVSGKLVFQAVLSEFVYDDDRAGGAGTSGASIDSDAVRGRRSSTQKQLPSPGALCRCNSPPIRRTWARAIEVPRPVPPYFRTGPVSTW